MSLALDDDFIRQLITEPQLFPFAWTAVSEDTLRGEHAYFYGYVQHARLLVDPAEWQFCDTCPTWPGMRDWVARHRDAAAVLGVEARMRSRDEWEKPWSLKAVMQRLLAREGEELVKGMAANAEKFDPKLFEYQTRIAWRGAEAVRLERMVMGAAS